MIPLFKSPDRFRYLLAITVGLLLVAAFPKPGIAGLAWIAPGAMLAAAFGTRGWRAFRIGWMAGFAHFLGSLYWLWNIPVMKLAPCIGWLALSGFLALYTGTWTWLCCRVWPALGGEKDETLALQLQRFAGSGWVARLRWTWVCAASWVALEMIRARFLGGFPWSLIGASQAKLVPLIQIASFTGVYGISFLVIWFSTALLCAVALFAAGGRAMRFAKLEVLLPLLVVVITLAWGLRVTVSPEPNGATLAIALVQPSIPQKTIWDPGEGDNRLAKLLEISERAMAGKPALMLWPEGAVPGFPRWETNIHHAVTNFARRHQTWVVCGGDDAAPNTSRLPEGYDEFNAAFLVNPEGKFMATYHKQHLVMFGEFIPLSNWLPFLTRWTGMGNFTPGAGPVRFNIPELHCNTSVLICFEDIFPHAARKYTSEDVDFLVNLTNDGWFGESAQQWQHATLAAFRAVENGVPLVRCANNGLTCWIDIRGRLRDTAFEGKDDIYGAGFKIVQVPLAGASGQSATFYRMHGDVFGWGCVALTTLVLLGSLRRFVA